ncbi:MAG: hypothetical protein WCO63_16010 [Bacteroidota bacterium]
MKLKTILIAFLVSIVLATITPPIFTSYAATPTVTALATGNPDSVVVMPTKDSIPGAWIDPSKLPPADAAGIFGIGAERLLAYLSGLITLILMVFPSVSKSKWYLWIFDFIAFFIPNFKQGGGVHQMNLFYSLYTYFFPKKA